MISPFRDTITIEMDGIELSGELVLPQKTTSLVLFSHGSGSSRFSPRNNFVAEKLQNKNIGTFLFDLLTKREDETYANRFNMDLLTDRLTEVTKYMVSRKELSALSLGYFGASTGAASALKAAARLPDIIQAVVSRGGRPDLAMDVAGKVKAPTLLIVGGHDYQVIELNRQALQTLKCETKLEIVPGATHLFEEPGTLDRVAQAAGNWFEKYLIQKKLSPAMHLDKE